MRWTDILLLSLQNLKRRRLRTLLTMLGVCGVRIAWIQWGFPQSRTFKTIMTAYPISLSTTALLVLTALLYYHPSRRIESARA